MLIEKELENCISADMSELPALSAYQIVCARDADKVEDEPGMVGVVSIAAQYRSHTAFNLTPIDIPVTLAIVTRLEQDASSEEHEAAVDAISDRLSYLHRYQDTMTEKLSGSKFMAGELSLNGGTGLQFSKEMGVFSDTIQMTIRGAEKFA